VRRADQGAAGWTRRAAGEVASTLTRGCGWTRSGRPPRRNEDPLKYESISTRGIDHAQPHCSTNRMHNRPEKLAVEGSRPSAQLSFPNKVQSMSLKVRPAVAATHRRRKSVQ
jgi:hypothetical protein